MSKLKVLITGGAGFIGSNFANINKKKYDIVVLDNLFLGDADNLDPDIKFIEGDACKQKDLEKCGMQFDIVIHFAGTSSAPMFSGEQMVWGYVNSIESFTRTLEFARKAGVNKFLYASTSSLYGNNTTPLVETQFPETTNHYSVSKVFYENCAQCYHKIHPEMDIVGFRFMSVYGPNEEAKGQFANVLSQFIWDFARGKSPIIFGDGTQTRDFTNVEDIAQAITLAIEHPKKLGNEIFNIGTGNAASLNEMIAIIKNNFETNLDAEYIKNPVKENYIMAQCADISKIKKVLGYKPKIDLETGIKRQIKALRPEKIKETSSNLIRQKK